MDLQLINLDAFSDGQITSKRWLLDYLESRWPRLGTVWIYGSWYGLLPQMLLLRGKTRVEKFCLFDIDPVAIEISRKVLFHWYFRKEVEIEFYVHDCNQPKAGVAKPDLIINTACEHFSNSSWFDVSPENTEFLLQSTNLRHVEHVRRSENLDEFAKSISPGFTCLHRDEKVISYPHSQFSRFMLHGRN